LDQSVSEGSDAALATVVAYQWTTSNDKVPFDAVIVGISGTSSIMLTAGMSYVEPTASIYWPDW